MKNDSKMRKIASKSLIFNHISSKIVHKLIFFYFFVFFRYDNYGGEGSEDDGSSAKRQYSTMPRNWSMESAGSGALDRDQTSRLKKNFGKGLSEPDFQNVDAKTLKFIPK